MNSYSTLRDKCHYLLNINNSDDGLSSSSYGFGVSNHKTFNFYVENRHLHHPKAFIDFAQFGSPPWRKPMSDCLSQDIVPPEDCACRIIEKVLYLDKEKLKKSLVYKLCDHKRLKRIETSVLFSVAKLFYLAITFNDIVLLKLLLTRMSPNFQDHNGRTSLHYAILVENDKEIICFLMIFGADPHKCDKNNISPLRLAEKIGKVDIIKLITKYDELINEMEKRPGLLLLIFKARKELTRLRENVDTYKTVASQVIEDLNEQLSEENLEEYNIDDRLKQIEKEILNDF